MDSLAFQNFHKMAKTENELIDLVAAEIPLYVEAAVELWHALEIRQLVLSIEVPVQFNGFEASLNQTTKTFYLVIVSLLRLHNAQALADLRYGIDHMVQCMFSLCKPVDALAATTADNQRKLQKCARVWLQEFDPSLSAKLKTCKDDILNEYGSHAKPHHAAQATIIVDGASGYVPFDAAEKGLTALNLLVCANVMESFAEFLLLHGEKNGIKFMEGGQRALRQALAKLDKFKQKML